jgi:hypothetical protein
MIPDQIPVHSARARSGDQWPEHVAKRRQKKSRRRRAIAKARTQQVTR